MFPEIRPINEVALNILQKRYFHPGEIRWEQVVDRVVDYILSDCEDLEQRELTRELIRNTYFIPNSPCLANSNTKSNGLSACFVVDMLDSIEEIYKTKLDFALIAKKAGGCGTTLSKLRPEGSKVNGSAHGFAGGPVNFANTICHDMQIISQNGLRPMAIMLVMDYTHPDIIKFITAKKEDGKLSNANISVRVDKNFIEKVKKGESYQTYFDFENGRIYYNTYKAQDIFDLIIDGMWQNGEPGIQFLDRINENTPYKYSNQKIFASNPCSEQYLPPNGVCNLGSIDFSKFLDLETQQLNLNKFELAIRLAVKFLDSVIDKSSYPTKAIEVWAEENRAIGLGGMGFADYLLIKKIPYGSKESLQEIEFLTKFMYEIAEDESVQLGIKKGVPKACQNLPVFRRNVTLLSYAPTGTLSLLAGCSGGIEPIFSEITVRNDKTGTYIFENNLAEKDYFRCAVSINNSKEVTWGEHLNILNAAQKFCDTGVSKTVNCPRNTHKETLERLFLYASELPYIKGFTVYRNQSRKQEVLSPKVIKKDKCPVCKSDLIFETGCKKCPDKNCGFSICTA